jgi:hypothetical protein
LERRITFVNPSLAARRAPAKSSAALGPADAPDHIDQFLELDQVRSFTLPFDMSILARLAFPSACGTARAAQWLLTSYAFPHANGLNRPSLVGTTVIAACG